MTLLQLDGLKTYYRTEEGDVAAADGVSLSVSANETLGLVGESGSGKTTVAKSIIRLLPDNGEIVGGTIDYQDEDVAEMSMKEVRQNIRWKEISMIPQNAMNGFDPVYTICDQIVEAIQVHEPDTSKSEARSRAEELFEELGLDADRIDDYPHQFSGGMAQRAMIALALAVNPAVILADEPTTALDVVIQDRILQTISELQDQFNTAMILITHDMSVVSETCDRIAVMYGGHVVETADADTVIRNPRHPYTLGLRNAFPDITADSQELISIPGTPPDLTDPDEGCRFAPRCPFAEEQCWEETPELEEFNDGHLVACFRADEAELLREEASKRETWQEQREDSEKAVPGGTSDE